MTNDEARDPAASLGSVAKCPRCPKCGADCDEWIIEHGYIQSVFASRQMWVPAARRMPKVGEPVLASGRDGCMVAWFDGRHWWTRVHRGEVLAAYGVTHWMPLPAPPQTDK
jgi:hypothetical protein